MQNPSKSKNRIRTARTLLTTALSCIIFVVSVCPATAIPISGQYSKDVDGLARQAANILGVETQLARLETLDRQNNSYSHEALQLRTLLYQRVMGGSLDVRNACNSIERELVYTYALMKREQKKQQNVSDVFNLLNFTQFGTLYTLEARSRLHGQFNQSAILTGVAAGMGILLPTMNILYGKLAKTRKVAPPDSFNHIVTGCPVNQIRFPSSVEKFLDSKLPQSSETRRDMLYKVWNKRFGTRAMANDALMSLVDGKRKSIGDLNNRIVHLWALHTFVQDFDFSILSLTRKVVPPAPPPHTDGHIDSPPLTLGESERQAIQLMGIEKEVYELAALQQNTILPPHGKALEMFVLGKCLVSSLEMRAASDRVYEELNYAYDVALAELEMRRGKALQKNFEANFIQINTFGAIACLLYLKDQTKAGNEMFVIGDSISLALSTLALIQTRGGKRKVDTPPNSLSGFFELDTEEPYRLSPLVEAFLESRDPNSADNLSHREELKNIWKRNKVATIDWTKKKNQSRLSAMSKKKDTIKILRSRVTLLGSLRVRLQLLDQQLLRVLNATAPSEKIEKSLPTASDTLKKVNENAWRTAVLIGAAGQANRILEFQTNSKFSTPQDSYRLLDAQVDLTRKLLVAKLEIQKTAANIEQEIAYEKTASDRLKRYRDTGIQLTNIANFYQIGVLGIVFSGILGLSSKKNAALYADRINVVSGLTIIGLASLAFLQKPGGVRLKKPDPNMLGPCLSIDSPAKNRYAPLLLSYLKEKDPKSARNLTRGEELLEFWQNTTVIDINMKKPANHEKVAATGKHHHWWNERIKLIENRVNMLFDLRSVVNLMERDRSELLQVALGEERKLQLRSALPDKMGGTQR